MSEDRSPLTRRPKDSLTPREEGAIRAELANTLETRLRLGLPAVIGRADGTAVTILPGEDAESLLADKPLKPAPDS